MRSAVLAIALAGCASASAPLAVAEDVAKPAEKHSPVVQVAAAVVEPVAAPLVLEPVEFDTWAGFGVANCSYLAPKNAVADDGAVDVIWHFHAGQMATKDMKASNARAVFVSCGYGIGTGGYSSNFDDPGRFGAMMKGLLRAVARKGGREAHLGHLALASWSAGFAAVNRILSVPEWYEKTDAVLLFDSLHAQYIDLPSDPKPKAGAPGPVAQRGADHVDTNMLRRFIRFAADAANGEKTMVITHSSIVPPDYASTAESTAALLNAIQVAPSGEKTAAEIGDPSLVPSVVADEGNLHVRGFRGYGPHDHFDHLHLIGDAVRTWLVPAWYTPGSERH